MTQNVKSTKAAFNWSTSLAYGFLALVALLVMLIGVAISPIGVSVLVSQLNKQAGINIEGVSGSFYSQIAARSIAFDNQQVSLKLTNFNIDPSLSCLFVGKVCLASVQAKAINLSLPITQEIEKPEPQTADMFEYISLPVAVNIDAINIDQFSLKQQNGDQDASPLLDVNNISLRLNAHQKFVVNKLLIEKIILYQSQATRKNVAAKAGIPNNKTELEANWLNTIELYQYTGITLPQIFIPLNAELRDTKITQICVLEQPSLNEFFCANNTTIKANVKQQNVIINLQSTPENVLASQVTLQGQLNLAKQFSHEFNLDLYPNLQYTNTQAGRLSVKAKGDIKQSNITFVDIQGVFAKLKITADISKDSLPLELFAEIKNLTSTVDDWLPNTNLPIQTAKATIVGDYEQYQFDLSASINSANASLISVSGQASIANKALIINKLSTSGDIGLFEATSRHQLTRKNNALVLNNTAELNFNEFQMQPLLASISTSITGMVSLSAELTPNELSANVLCSDIKGTVNDLELSLLCDIALNKKGLLKVNTLALQQGQNKLFGNGSVQLPFVVSTENITQGMSQINDAKSDFTLNADFADLSSFYPKIAGVVNAQMNVTGAIKSPLLNARIKAQNLAMLGNSIDYIDLETQILLADDYSTTFKANIDGVSNQQLVAQNIQASIDGDLSSHKISLVLKHPDYGFEHEFSGKANIESDDPSWSGKWNRGVWKLPFDEFTLAKPTTLALLANNMKLAAHCWLSSRQASNQANNQANNQPASPNGINISQAGVCVNQADLENGLGMLNAKLQYNLNTPLRHYFPEVIQTGSTVPLNSDISISYSKTAGFEADVFNLITQSLLVTTKHQLDLDAVVANMRLDKQVLNTNVFAGTTQTGSIGLTSTIDLAPETRQHTAELRIEQFQLSPLLRFVPSAEKLAGIIQGKVKISGDLLTPTLNGHLYINDGELVVDNYPYPFSEFNQSIELINSQANIEGEFELGAGDAQYTAQVSFDNGISASGKLRGAGMQIAYQNSELLLSPNIQFDVTPDKVSLKGELAVPNAQIVIKELPQSAKSASSDTIIIGKPAEPALIPIGLDIDLRLLIDAPKLSRVNIDALDLRASLAGDLQLKVLQQTNPATGQFRPLETYLNGNISILSGRYEAYGQMLQVRSGEVYFSGSPSLPQFDITAVRNPLNTSDSVVAGVRVSGNPVVPKVELFSEPVMIQARQLSYLLQGTDLPGSGSSGSTGSNDVQLINMLVNYGVGSSENRVNKLGKSLGFDSLNIQTAGQGNAARVQLTGRISDRIQITYGVGLFDPVSVIILKYQLLPKLYIEASSGVTRAVDLFYEVNSGGRNKSN